MSYYNPPLPHFQSPGPLFPADNVWNAPVDTLPVDAHSAAYVATIGAGNSVAEQRDGHSAGYVAYTFDYSFTYNDGYGSGATASFPGGAFAFN